MPQVCHHWLSAVSAVIQDYGMVDVHITFQGGMDILENPFNTAERELLEETGISSITFLAQVQCLCVGVQTCYAT